MGFWKTLFGAQQDDAVDEKQSSDEKRFDLMKFDGVKAMRMGQGAYAVKCFNEALKVHDDPETRLYLSHVLTQQGNLQEALLHLLHIAKAQPGNVPVLQQAAHVAYMMEDYERMGTLCDVAMTVDAANARTCLLAAQAALGKGERVQAIARLTQAVAIDPQMADARLLRGQVLLQMGDTAGARADADWLGQSTEPSEDTLLLQARIAHAEGRDDDAIAIYDKVNEMNPFQLDAFRERGRIRFERGDKQGAQEDMQQLLELNPGEMEGMSGAYEAESVEQMMKRAYSPINPFGL